jgi:hypothetical protein
MFNQLKYSYNYEEEKFFPKLAILKLVSIVCMSLRDVTHISTLSVYSLCVSGINVSRALWLEGKQNGNDEEKQKVGRHRGKRYS